LAPALHPLVQFNLSHSGDLVLIALGRGRALGVDVEQIRMDVATENIAVRFFSDKERRDLASVPPVLQREAFFACWTRKEAYVKARGDGLSLRLEQFDVSFLKKRSRVSLKLGMILPKWTAGPCAHGREDAVTKRHWSWRADWELKCWDLPAKAVGAMISHRHDSRA
jgi:phosphopantetheinyl transferase